MTVSSTIKATPEMYAAAEKATRAAIEAYSEFDSSMIPDTLLNQMVQVGIDAALKAAPTNWAAINPQARMT